MEAKAIARYVRIAPRKLRIVIDLIRGKAVGEAFAILKHTPKVGSEVIDMNRGRRVQFQRGTRLNQGLAAIDRQFQPLDRKRRAKEAAMQAGHLFGSRPIPKKA